MPDPISANAYLAIEQETIVFTNTEPKEADFQVKCQAVVLSTTAAVHVAFDSAANHDDLLLPANTVLEIHPPLEYTRISAIGDAGGGTLYILARR